MTKLLLRGLWRHGAAPTCAHQRQLGAGALQPSAQLLSGGGLPRRFLTSSRSTASAAPFLTCRRPAAQPWAGAPALAPRLLLLAAPTPRRQFHATPASAGGRHTTGLPERQKHWRQHISKKALKRYRARRERKNLADGAARGNAAALAAKAARGGGGGQGGALLPASPAASALLPSPAELALQSKADRRVLESMLWQQPPTPKPSEALKVVDAAELVAALRSRRLPHTEANFNYAIRVLGAQGSFAQALQLFAAMRGSGLRPSVYSYTALLSACAEQRNLGAAREAWAAMTAEGIKPSDVAYGALIHTAVRAWDLPAAFAALGEAEAAGIKLSAVLFTHVMVGCLHAGQYDRVWDVFQHMRIYHCEPDVVTFTVLINACAKRDEVEKALGLLTEMQQMGLEPTHVTYNALLHCAGRSFRRFEHAFDLFEEMASAGFAHDLRSYQAVLLACAHRGEVARARGFMHRLVGQGLTPDIVTINTLLSVYSRGSGGVLSRFKRPSPNEWHMRAAEGGDLLKWEDPVEAKAMAEKLETQRTWGEHARVIDGDVDVLVENMLADYFNEEKQGRPVSQSDAEVEGSIEEQLPSLLPAAAELHQDTQSPEFVEGVRGLVRLGIADSGEIEELVAANTRPPLLDSDEEAARARVDELGERVWQARVEQQALDAAQDGAALASLETQLDAVGAGVAGQMGVDLRVSPSDARAAAEAEAAGRGASPSRVRSAGIRAEMLNRVLSGRLMVDEVTHGPGGKPAPQSRRTAAQQLQDAAEGRGPRVSFADYVRTLEHEVDAALFGTALAPALPAHLAAPQPQQLTPGGGLSGDVGGGGEVSVVSAPVGRLSSSAAAPSSAAVTANDRLPSAFDSDGQIGGRPVRELLDISTIPAPDTSDSDGDHDVMHMQAYYHEAVSRRFADALEREFFASTARAVTAVAPGAGAQGAVGATAGLLGDLDRGIHADLLESGLLSGSDGGDRSGGAGEDGSGGDMVVLERVAPVFGASPPTLVRRRRSGAPPTPSTSVLPRPSSLAPNIQPPAWVPPAPSPPSAAVPLGTDAPAASPLTAAAVGAYGAPAAADYASTAPDAGSAAVVSEWLARLDAALIPQPPAPHGGSPSTAAAASAVQGDYSPPLGPSTADITATSIGPPPSPADPQAPHPSAADLLALGEAMERGMRDGAAERGAAATGAADGEEEDERSAALARAAEVWANRPAVIRANTPVEELLRKGFAARVLAAMLRHTRASTRVISIDAALVVGTEGLRKFRKRRVMGTAPGFLDTMMAAHTLKGRMLAPSEGAPRALGAGEQPPSSPSSALTTPALGGGLEQGEAAARAAQEERHAQRQHQALSRLNLALRNKAAGGKRLRALTALSEKLVGGLAWLPRGDYPSSPSQRKRVYLEEMRRIYDSEMPRLGLRPDAWTLNTVLTGYCVAGHAGTAYAFLSTEFPRHGVTPDVVSYRALLRLHLLQRDTGKMEAVVVTMRDLGVAPDRDCLGMLVHARARDYRLKDAIATVREMKAAGLVCSETHAKLLRARCAEMGVAHADVPAHPTAWQFTARVMKMRRARGRVLNKVVSFGLRPMINGLR